MFFLSFSIRLSTLLTHWLSARAYNCTTYLREGTLLQSDIPNHSYPTPFIFALSGLTSARFYLF